MALADLLTAAITNRPIARPLDAELDLFGLTHPGKVRTENQDHFLIGTVHQQVVIHGTSLPTPEVLSQPGERLATIMLVADGVGGRAGGREASELATETIARYVSSTLRGFDVAGSSSNEEFLLALRAAAREAHAKVRAEAKARPEAKQMATTLTVVIAVWPWAYVLQVGDSRCYMFQDGALRQVTRDQTVAQDLVDLGVLPADRVRASPYNNVLARAIGAEEATPEVSRVDIGRRGTVLFLCSDGLTKHVTDAEIAELLGSIKSAQDTCRRLVDLALERGGSDNVTVLIGRANRTS
jgi:serine/threonine protein phosphatase PrpC